MRIIRSALIPFLSCMLVVLVSSCGREYHLVGIVLQSSGSQSSLREITGSLLPEKGTPVAGATVTLYHELDKGGKPVVKSNWKRSIVTDAKGRFELRDYATPGVKNLVGLEVRKDGFAPVYITYWDYIDKKPQVFVAELAPGR